MAEQREEEHAVRQAMRRLGGRCEVLLLTALYLEQLPPSHDEISRRLGIPRGSVSAMRTRCLSRILAELQTSS